MIISNNNKKISYKYQHSVMPSLDYLFAKEFYDQSDSRYNFVKYFKKIILEKMSIEVYNCKIENVNTSDNYYNVYVYLYDLKSIIDNETNYLDNVNKKFEDLFYKALKEYPIKELEQKKLNQNGIFLIDFFRCARCNAISRAFNEIEMAIKKSYSQVDFITYFDDIIYVFFQNQEKMDEFLKGDIITFKNLCYKAIKPYDLENVFDTNKLTFMLDILNNYTSIGGRNYFNSDAMYKGKII